MKQQELQPTRRSRRVQGLDPGQNPSQATVKNHTPTNEQPLQSNETQQINDGGIPVIQTQDNTSYQTASPLT